MTFDVFFILMLVLIALVVVFIFRNASRLDTVWQAAADQLGLAAEPRKGLSKRRMSGPHGETVVTVETYRKNVGGKSSTDWTRYRVAYPALSTTFRLKRQTGLTRIATFFGARDVEVGDEDFDALFQVDTEDPAGLRRLLTPARRTTAQRLLGVHPAVEIDEQTVQLSVQGIPKDPAEIVTVVGRLVSAAHQLAEPRSTTEKALKARREGMLTQAASSMNRVVEQLDDADPATAEDRLIAAELRAATGDRQGAEELYEGLSRVLPRDPEVAAGLARTSKAGPAEATTAAGPLTDPGPIARELFGSTLLSFETDRIFDERYRDRRVRWAGTVRRAERTGVFVTIMSIEHDLYGNQEIDAVVDLPEATASRLQRGAEIEFEGTLSGVDSLMRTVVVSGASLVR